MNLYNLPTPTAEAKFFSDQLTKQIAHEIEQQGPITFARYMEMALYTPGLGYYRSGTEKFGSTGDYVTAPEISPLFSQCVAQQCGQVLSHFSGGDILELGAGNGLMALEILRTLEKQQQLPRYYFILELSAELQQRQQKLFAQQAPYLLEKIQWLTTLPRESFYGVIVANEVIDAMPVHKFKMENGVKEFFVDYQNEKFVWQLREPHSNELEKRIRLLDVPLAADYESEINLMLPAWMASLEKCLAGGLILLIDYGFPRHEYYHPDRSMGTVMCHYQHLAHSDPLILPGIQDITAHVDFTSIAEAAVNLDLQVGGYTSQAAFLLNCGLIENMMVVESGAQHRVAQAIKRLTSPNEMGELFKAIALTRHFSEPLMGFARYNQVERLACRVW